MVDYAKILSLFGQANIQTTQENNTTGLVSQKRSAISEKQQYINEKDS